MSEILRTPDDRFAELPGFPWAPRYVEELPGYQGLRMHYVDEGPAEGGETFVCLHGQPTWAYLYRSWIPVLTAAGHRVIAPDLFGFGRSDKPADDPVYTFDFHRGALRAFLDRVAPERFTLVLHDWGGILGLTLPMEMPERVERLIVMNTSLACGDVPLGKGFLEWRAWAASQPDMDVARLMRRACPELSEAEAAAYGAPFPGVAYKAGVRRFPQLVAESEDSPGAATARRAREWLKTEWAGPTFMAVGMDDPVLGPPAMRLLRSWIRGCPPPLEVAGRGHFVPEAGGEIAPAALAAFAAGEGGGGGAGR